MTPQIIHIILTLYLSIAYTNMYIIPSPTRRTLPAPPSYKANNPVSHDSFSESIMLADSQETYFER